MVQNKPTVIFLHDSTGANIDKSRTLRNEVIANNTAFTIGSANEVIETKQHDDPFLRGKFIVMKKKYIKMVRYHKNKRTNLYCSE